MASVAVECVGVGKGYLEMKGFWGFLRPQRKLVLEKVDLAIEVGEIVRLTGPNGAGKTTLLKLIAGLLQPDRGEVRVAGMRPDRPSARARAGLAISISESRSLYWRLTGRQNLRFFATLWGLEGAAAERAVGDAAAAMGIGDWLERSVMGYSSGMMQRLALARNLLVEPRIWLLDEPTRDLDEEGCSRLAGLLEQLRSRGGCALVATHGWPELERLAAKTVVLDGCGGVALQSVAPGPHEAAEPGGGG